MRPGPWAWGVSAFGESPGWWLIDGMNCTPASFKEKPLGIKLTVPFIETIDALENRLFARYLILPAVSSIRFAKPHSLSHHSSALTRRLWATRVREPSTTTERGS